MTLLKRDNQDDLAEKEIIQMTLMKKETIKMILLKRENQDDLDEKRQSR
jgi:hypothetical protein